MNVVYFCAKSGQETLGDGISGFGPVELEDADMARGWRWDVGDADERFGFGGVETPDEWCEARRGEGHSGRHDAGGLVVMVEREGS